MRPISCIQINLLSNVLVAPNRLDPLREGLSSTVKHKPNYHSHLRQPRLGVIRCLPQKTSVIKTLQECTKTRNEEMDTIRTNHPTFGRWRISRPEYKLGKTYIKFRRIMLHLSGCILTIGKAPK